MQGSNYDKYDSSIDTPFFMDPRMFFGAGALNEAVNFAMSPLVESCANCRDFIEGHHENSEKSLGKELSRMAVSPVVAGLELFELNARYYKKPKFNLGPDIIERDVIKDPFMTLKSFQKQNGEPKKIKVLLLSPFSGHHATLLRGTVAALVEHDNVEVLMTDWTDARYVPYSAGRFGIGKYKDRVKLAAGFDDTRKHILAVCQSGPASLAATAQLCEEDSPFKPKTLTIMGAPIDVSVGKTEVNKFAESYSIGWFRDRLIETVPVNLPGAGRRIRCGNGQVASFMGMNMPTHSLKMWEHACAIVSGNTIKREKNSGFYKEYYAASAMHEPFFLETVHKIFIQNLLAKEKLEINGRRIDTKAIKEIPLKTIEGKRDDICGKGQTEAAQGLCDVPSSMMEHSVFDVGHYGLFEGGKWRKEICPEVVGFMTEHNEDRKKIYPVPNLPMSFPVPSQPAAPVASLSM